MKSVGSHPGVTVVPPGEVTPAGGDHFRVFTPYHRAWQAAERRPVLGAAFLVAFFLYIRARERAGKEPLLSTSLFRNRTSNLGLVTQNVQWLLLMGVSFVVAVYLQTVRDQNAIETGVIFTAGVAAGTSSTSMSRSARSRPARTG